MKRYCQTLELYDDKELIEAYVAEYQVPYADYEFTFILTPVRHNIGIQ